MTSRCLYPSLFVSCALTLFFSACGGSGEEPVRDTTPDFGRQPPIAPEKTPSLEVVEMVGFERALPGNIVTREVKLRNVGESVLGLRGGLCRGPGGCLLSRDPGSTRSACALGIDHARAPVRATGQRPLPRQAPHRHDRRGGAESRGDAPRQ